MEGFYPQAQAKGKSNRPAGNAQTRAAPPPPHLPTPERNPASDKMDSSGTIERPSPSAPSGAADGWGKSLRGQGCTM